MSDTEIDLHPGVDDGTVVANDAGEQERIVHDKDAEGTVTGWHKEEVA